MIEIKQVQKKTVIKHDISLEPNQLMLLYGGLLKLIAMDKNVGQLSVSEYNFAHRLICAIRDTTPYGVKFS